MKPRESVEISSSRPLAAELWSVAQAVAADLGPAARTLDEINACEVRSGGRSYLLEYLPNVGTTVSRSHPAEQVAWQSPVAQLWLRRLELAATLIEGGGGGPGIWQSGMPTRRCATPNPQRCTAALPKVASSRRSGLSGHRPLFVRS